MSEPLCRMALHQAGILKSEVYTHACTACVMQDGAVGTPPPWHKWELEC